MVTKHYPDVNFHLLGVADELLLEYGVFSSDSTAYLNARKYRDGHKIYLSDGRRIKAPDEMSTLDIIKQNLQFLIGLENVEDIQISLAI